jgi:tripartite-type tricarboxylate transporter receptor subunit TctC
MRIATMRGFAVALALCAGAAFAQGFPSKPVRIVVPFPPGGSTDIAARLVAPKLAELWKQPVVVENKPGAAANIGADFVAKSPPDGHTQLLATTALAASAAIFDKLTYDPQRDLAPVVFVAAIPNLLVVHPSVPAATPQAFVAYARANPGKLNFASPGASTGQRLTFELLKQMTGIEVVHVAYKGGAPAGQALLAGEVQSMIMNVVEAQPHVKGGRLRALAATTLKRAPGFPDVPTLAETVAPGLDASVWQGLLVAGGTAPDVIARIRADWIAVLAQPDVRERLVGLGMDVTPGTSAEFARFLGEEIAKWKKVAQTANIKGE